MEFWRYYRIIRRRWLLILLGMVVCIGAVGYKLSTTKTEYVGRTTLQESASMGQIGVPIFQSQMMTSQMDVQLRLSNLSNIATSVEVINRAADDLKDLGLDSDTVLENLKVQPVKDTNILAVEVTLPDRTEARLAAGAIADAFKSYYSELNNKSIRDSRAFIESQIASTRKAMIDVQDKLKQFKETNGVVTIDAQTGAQMVARLIQIKQQKGEYDAARDASIASANAVDREFRKIDPKKLETISKQIARNPTWDRLTQQLAELETAKAGMTNGLNGQPRRGPNHPDVLDVDRKIAETNDQLKNTTMNYTSATVDARNQNYSTTFDRWVSAKVDEAGATARSQAMAQVLAQTQTELKSFPAQEAELAELQTDLDVAKTTYQNLKSKLYEARIRERQVRNENALQTIDPPSVTKVDQRIALKLILAILLSPLLGIGAAFLLHYADRSVRTVADAEVLFGLPVLSAIPISGSHSLPAQKCSDDVATAYLSATSALWLANQGQQINSIAIVSTGDRAGCSTTASNIAASLAAEGAKVVLVDADMRSPQQSSIFGIPAKAGLSNILTGGAALEDALVPTKVQGLLLIPAGPVPGNPVKLLRSKEMKNFVDQLKDLADFVVYDTPGGIVFPDSALIASQVGSAVIVQAAGCAPVGGEIDFRSRLESTGVRFLGTIFNKIRKDDLGSRGSDRRSYEDAYAQLPGGTKAIRN